ncbi:MAG: hypothetical protein A2X25_02415 [Chloroflexi bacterium GWB2_49_20]|nr:MAG: hypothetical protein A2X25_02415 [Chloroflexi bacterium GWB2_49_20]OGN79707.1 MAG: hypothetical protein A2X26_07395 [Chloroflexi bacterium GWC2_49_37]OGN85955.1 MAG: hypothetical protein A2X27_00155 [Chloroflexi bacterium GWD2_49_16]HBG73984.1 hypothetical protein [Anaerolineae bacterium]HCC78750.1 hypothetical protein [Anaerolineae bacterium]
MEEKEKMVPLSTAVRLFTTGMEWEAGLFIETFRELIKRMPKEEAREILGKAMYRTGHRLGVEAREFSKTQKGPQGMAEAWDVLYGVGTKEAPVLNDDQFVFRVFGCAAFDLMKRWGMEPDEILFVGRAYCAGDTGQAKGFDEDMFFQHTRRLMAGDDDCVWDYTTYEQEKAKSAAAVAELGLDK